MDERAGAAVEGMAKALKRRGLIAGAAALVAEMVAKQAAQPVAANTDGQPLIIANPNTESTAGTSLTWTGGPITSGAAFNVTDGGAILPYSAMVSGIATGGKAYYGVYGAGQTGVYGSSNSFHAVVGDLYAPKGSGAAGVFGYGNADGTYGVYGLNTGTGYGVSGQNDSAGGTAVRGDSLLGFPVIGVATGGTNSNAGVLGIGTLGPGVQGQSYAGHGLVGTTSATDGQHAALIGSIQSGGNAVALRGSVPAGATGYAGVFDGDVIVNGALRVYGSPKNAAVRHPDNSYRLLYCEESPESWFADYGESKLTNGRADVKLDADFAALVHAEEYHVFLTAEGDSKGLYVAEKTAVGFVVREQQGGTSGVAFAYRVVAKRKDIAGERLAKVAPPPPVKPVTPFTVPETPTPQPPAKNP